MRTYNYKAKNKDGELKKGVIKAVNEEEAAHILDLNDLILITLQDKEKEVDLSHLETSKHVSQKDLMIFSKQLAGMIGAGLPVVESLITIGEDERNRYFSGVILNIAQEVEGGATLTGAMEGFPKIFSEIYLSMIRVGESSGKISETLQRLALQLEKDYQFRAQVKGAMIYPIFILTTLVTVALLAVTFVFPKLTPILKSAGVKLPIITQVLIFASEGFLKFWFLIIPAVIGAAFFLYFFTRKGGGKALWSEIKLHIPIAGKIIKDIYMARFMRTFSILISGGVDVTKTLEITAKSVGNIHYETAILKARDVIKNGGTLTQAFEGNKYMTNFAKKMIKVGESTGNLDTITDNAAEFYEEEVNYQVSNLSKTLEPLLVILMGIGVALFVSAILMPLYDATMSVGKM